MLIVLSPWRRSGRGGSSRTSRGSSSILSGTATQGSVTHQPPDGVTARFLPRLRWSWIWILTSEESCRYRADQSSCGLNHSLNVLMRLFLFHLPTSSCYSELTFPDNQLMGHFMISFFFRLVDINNILTQFVFTLFKMDFNLFFQLHNYYQGHGFMLFLFALPALSRCCFKI